jgi:hypothetical protein
MEVRHELQMIMKIVAGALLAIIPIGTKAN